MVFFVFCFFLFFGLDLLELFLIVHKHEGPLTPNPVGCSQPLIHYISYRISTSWGIVGYSVLHKMSHTSQTRHVWKCQWVWQSLQLWGPRKGILVSWWSYRGTGALGILRFCICHTTLGKTSNVNLVLFDMIFNNPVNGTYFWKIFFISEEFSWKEVIFSLRNSKCICMVKKKN